MAQQPLEGGARDLVCRLRADHGVDQLAYGVETPGILLRSECREQSGADQRQNRSFVQGERELHGWAPHWRRSRGRFSPRQLWEQNMNLASGKMLWRLRIRVATAPD